MQVGHGIILVCDSAILNFRAGTSSRAILARARDKWGPGTITDNEGYEVTEESRVLVPDQYEYQRSSASKTSVLGAELRECMHTQAITIKGSQCSLLAVSLAECFPVKQVTAVSRLRLWLEAYPASCTVFSCTSSGQELCFAA